MRADEEALRVALDALLENAVKYTEPHDAIEVSSRVLDFGLVIEVADSGRVVAPEALDRIFDRFARGDDVRSRTNGGVGLGLAIVDAVAKAHGGSCTVTPRRSGTVFALRLPDFQQRRSLDAPPTAGGAGGSGGRLGGEGEGALGLVPGDLMQRERIGGDPRIARPPPRLVVVRRRARVADGRAERAAPTARITRRERIAFTVMIVVVVMPSLFPAQVRIT